MEAQSTAPALCPCPGPHAQPSGDRGGRLEVDPSVCGVCVCLSTNYELEKKEAQEGARGDERAES
eukprot:scaffold120485_cov35-Tisochrysis_lutea.AAC.1